MKTKLWITDVNGTIVAMSFTDLAAKVEAKCKGTEAAYIKPYFAVALDGKGEPTMDESTGFESAAQIKAYTAAWKAVQEMVKFHNEHQKELDNAEKRRKEELEKQGEQIALAEVKAESLVDVTVRDGGIQNIQSGLGEKFVVSATGISGAEGAELSQKDILGAVAYMAKSADGIDKLKTVTTWGFGDMVVLAAVSLFTGPDGKVNDDDLDDFVAQLCDTTGRSAQTVKQARRVSEYFDGTTPARTRQAGLSFTHHQEAFNYANGVDASTKEGKAIIAKIGELIQKAPSFKQKNVKDVKGKVTKVIDVPMPVAEFRAELQKITGKTPTAKPSPEPTKTVDANTGEQVEAKPVYSKANFVYVASDGNVFYSATLQPMAFESHACTIDISGDVPVLVQDLARQSDLTAEVLAEEADANDDDESDANGSVADDE